MKNTKTKRTSEARSGSLDRMVRPIPRATYINKCEGWTAQYDFVDKMRQRLLKSEHADFVPSMEGIDIVITELKRLKMVAMADMGTHWPNSLNKRNSDSPIGKSESVTR